MEWKEYKMVSALKRFYDASFILQSRTLMFISNIPYESEFIACFTLKSKIVVGQKLLTSVTTGNCTELLSWITDLSFM